MAPRKRPAPEAPAPAPVPESAAGVLSSHPAATANSAYLSKLEAIRHAVFEHPAMEGVVADRALAIASSKKQKKEAGSQAPFDPNQCEIALDTTGTYICGGVFFWQDSSFSPTPGIPVRESHPQQTQTS